MRSQQQAGSVLPSLLLTGHGPETRAPTSPLLLLCRPLPTLPLIHLTLARQASIQSPRVPALPTYFSHHQPSPLGNSTADSITGPPWLFSLLATSYLSLKATLTQSPPCFYKPVKCPSQKSQASLAAFSDHHIQPPDGRLVPSLDGSSQLALLPTQHCFVSKPL